MTDRFSGMLALMTRTADLPVLKSHPEYLDWPTHVWPEASTEDHLSADGFSRLSQMLDRAFSEADRGDLGETHALLIVQHGRLICERYGTGFDAASTHKSWSMAKSITQAQIGIAVRDGLIDISERAPVPEWSDTSDPRHAITWDQLLRMSSGLEWVEDYEPGNPSDVIAMLFGEKALEDTGAFAANKPLQHAPGSHWYYSSGTTNILARALGQVLNAKFGDLRDYMFAQLFDPIGMTSPMPVFDKAGTFVGSSFCYCTAQDFARFGYLYLRDGVWNGQRILPEGWVDYARTPTPVPETEALGYGAHWWLGLCGPGSFSANGYHGQYTIVIPELDLVIVRHGVSEGDEGKIAVQTWLGELADCFRG